MPDPLVLEIISFCLQHLSLVSGLLFREEAVSCSQPPLTPLSVWGRWWDVSGFKSHGVKNGARCAMVCAGIGQLGVNIPAQSTYYHTNMKYWNISTIMHELYNTLLILLGEASNLPCPPPNSFWVYVHFCCCKRF